jgi:HEAT repeat protein
MSLCNRAKPRAAATAALSYAAAEDPLLMAGAISDPRWYVVRNAVFILGQIGGPDVVDLLLIASRHPEPRVRRQVVQSLGSAPPERRLPLLLNQLDTKDQQLLAGTLNMLARDRHPRALKVLLERYASPNFQYSAEWVQRAYVNTLQDWVDDKTVPLLESLVMRGGWMAAPSPVRDAAARMLYRLGTENAMAALELGLRSRYEIIRQTCLNAMSGKEAA